MTRRTSVLKFQYGKLKDQYIGLSDIRFQIHNVEIELATIQNLKSPDKQFCL